MSGGIAGYVGAAVLYMGKTATRIRVQTVMGGGSIRWRTQGRSRSIMRIVEKIVDFIVMVLAVSFMALLSAGWVVVMVKCFKFLWAM